MFDYTSATQEDRMGNLYDNRDVIKESIDHEEVARERVAKFKVDDKVKYPFIGGYLIITKITPDHIFTKNKRGDVVEFFGVNTPVPGLRVSDFVSSRASLYPYKWDTSSKMGSSDTKSDERPQVKADNQENTCFIKQLKVGDRAVYRGIKGFLVITNKTDEVITARSLDNPSITFHGESTSTPGLRIGDINYRATLSPYRSYKSLKADIEDVQDSCMHA